MSDQPEQRRPHGGPDAHIPQQLRSDWREIDEYTMKHLHPQSRGNNAEVDAVLAQTLESGRKANMPPGNVSPAWGKFLTIQARAIKAKRALEVGTLAGFSAIWLTTQVQDLRLDTVECSEKHAEVARRNIAAAGVSDRVTVHQGPGLEVLPKLEQEILNGKRERYSFTFIDADKPNSAAYFDYAVKMSKPGSLVFVDNVMGRRGVKVSEDDPQDEHAVGGKRLIERVGKDERVDATVMQFVGAKGYDGFLVAIVL